MTLQPQLHHHHQHHHRLSTCHRQPTKPITGFCAQCLRERLSTINPSTTTTTTLTPNLRRTKSFSSTTNPNATTTNPSEPRRKSCDVRAHHNTLSDLFNLETQTKKPQIPPPPQEEIIISHDDFEEEGEFKTMKEFIDLEWERKKNNRIRSSFWETASVFSKKLTKWQRKHKKNKQPNNTNLVNVRRLRDTQSEIGRRSRDTDPRLSVDVARVSLDEFRYSFDEPRASWDPRFTPLVSVIEDVNVNVNANVNVNVNVNEEEEGERSPGGSAQTRDYYGEAMNLQRRRRSFDNRRDVDEGKAISNAKVSPETVGLFHGAKLLVTEKELRDSNWYSIKDYKKAAESGESAAASCKDVGLGGSGGVSEKGFSFKKSRRWRNVWNIWGLIQRRSESKCGDEEERCGEENVVDGVLAESWQKLRRVANGDAGGGGGGSGSGGVSQKLIRSYSVSARNNYKLDALVHGKNYVETNIDGMKRREEVVLQRNRSARYSPNNLDNGLLRFYLTPSRTFKKSKSAKSRLKNVHSIAGNVL